MNYIDPDGAIAIVDDVLYIYLLAAGLAAITIAAVPPAQRAIKQVLEESKKLAEKGIEIIQRAKPNTKSKTKKKKRKKTKKS